MVLIRGLRLANDIHMRLLGSEYDANKFPYALAVPPVSYLEEADRLDLVRLRMSVVNEYGAIGQTLQLDPRVWASYMLLEYAKLPPDLVLKLIKREEKAPDDPIAAGGPRVERMQSEHVARALNGDRRASDGFTELSTEEKQAARKLYEGSPTLRAMLERFTERGQLMRDDEELARIASTQVDPALIPPNGFRESPFTPSPEEKLLVEDLQGVP